MFLLDRMLDSLHYCSLTFGADLLGPLESNQRHLEVMGCLLQGRLVLGLDGNRQRGFDIGMNGEAPRGARGGYSPVWLAVLQASSSRPNRAWPSHA